jgi:hypothetical protein
MHAATVTRATLVAERNAGEPAAAVRHLSRAMR